MPVAEIVVCNSFHGGRPFVDLHIYFETGFDCALVEVALSLIASQLARAYSV